MTDDYPRDMIGYGRTPPFADWPGGARVALQFVINYEEGGENNILHGDAASEAFLSEIVGAAPWPGHAPHEHGVDLRIWLARRLLAAASHVRRARHAGDRLRRGDGDGAQPEAVAAMNEAGWEIATHGYKWIDYRDTPERDGARSDIAEAIRIHTEVAGARPLGFYQGRSSINTIPLGCEEGGFVYCADAYADDLPYYIDGPKGPQLIVPYTLDSNDMRFATPQGFNSGDQFFAYLKDAFDMLYAEGETAPKMLSIGLHCRLVGRPGRAASLARFLDYVREPRQGLGRDPARHRPPLDRQACAAGRLEAVATDAHAVRRAVRRRLRTFALGRGGRFRRGPDAAADSAEGLAATMAAAMARRERRSQKRALILAHPDLAGTARARQTADARNSTNEQASAGLDRLSRGGTRALHRRSTTPIARRFGFPFIMAVKGRTKAEIFAAFERRLDNDAADRDCDRAAPRSTASPRCDIAEILP